MLMLDGPGPVSVTTINPDSCFEAAHVLWDGNWTPTPAAIRLEAKTQRLRRRREPIQLEDGRDPFANRFHIAMIQAAYQAVSNWLQQVDKPVPKSEQTPQMRHYRSELLRDAVQSLGWIFSDEPTPGMSISFTECAEMEGADVTEVRKRLLHMFSFSSQARRILSDYVEEMEHAENANRNAKRSYCLAVG